VKHFLTLVPFAARLPDHMPWVLCVPALAWCWMSLLGPISQAREVGEPVVWVADRDRSRIYGLDADMILSQRREVGWPLRVVARSDGGLWVARSGNATPDFGARLTLLLPETGGPGVQPSGWQEAGELWLDAFVDCALAPDDSLWCLERSVDGSTRLLHVRSDVTTECLLQGQFLHVRVTRAGVWCVTADQRLLHVSFQGAVQGAISWGRPIVDLVPEGTAHHGMWVLLGGEQHALTCVQANLTALWWRELPVRATELALDPDVGGGLDGCGGWLLDPRGGTLLRVTQGAGATPEVTLAVVTPQVALAAPRLLLAMPGAVAVVASPGGLLRYDHAGQILPGQGGFGWISSLARATHD